MLRKSTSIRIAPAPLHSKASRPSLVPVEIRAATKLQARARASKARAAFQARIRDRQARLVFFSYPIVVASVVDIVGNTVVLDKIDRGELDQQWILFSLLFTVPSVLVLVTDMRRQNRPRFSLGHAIFLVSVLYRACTKAARIDGYIWDELTEALEPYRNLTEATSGSFESDIDLVATAVPLLTMCFHLAIFIGVTALGKMSLNLVATTNACPHLLFPFQFFDFVFLYSFFSLRSMNLPLESSWIAQQILLQVNIVFRNSGTTDALTKRYMSGFFRFLTGGLAFNKTATLRGADPTQDPLLRLQYLARLGWQYDLADVAALISTPSVVSIFVWRDGVYHIDGTTMVIRPCDLRNVWIRFGVLMCIKPAASLLAREWLRSKMRKTLLGKKTMHGTSQLAAKIMAERKMVAGGSATCGDEKVQEAFSKVYVEEELVAIQKELEQTKLPLRLGR